MFKGGIGRNVLIGAIVLLMVVLGGVAAFFVFSGSTSSTQEVSTDEPTDIVYDFYLPWLEAALSTSTNPYKEDLLKYPYLGKELRARLKEAEKNSDGVDPVICQTTLPSKISTRIVSKTEEQVEILVTPSRSAQSLSTEQSLVTLLPLNGGWYINEIRCSAGEIGPEREFSFDREGFLLKDVPKPLNPEYWHLIFEEDGELGHFAPLLFSAGSVCVALDGNAGACAPETFVETSKAHVQGEMSEIGVEVKRLEFKK